MQGRSFQFVIERHPDGYVAYPLGVDGVVVGEGETADEALADARSALAFHVETFGEEVLDSDSPVLDARVAVVEDDVAS
ncbi:MAG: type II toxin-antitoxin system HicB family antitoxin [Dehalococcoidia bacterium]|nr:type II toxin-antitoxin system HicB family antitoxin [Dehalococcoidia bacterium]